MKKTKLKRLYIMSPKKELKIYTKGGDKGKTSLVGGNRVPKYHERIEAYGTVDELISYIGLIRDHDIDSKTKESLLFIQDRLMVCASLLACDNDDSLAKLPKIAQSDVLFLETEIDNMEKVLPKLMSFILPGGHISSSYCHIARNICRRAERRIIFLNENTIIEPNILRFVNRLSDYLFVLARKLVKDFNSNEILWKPNL